MGAVLDIVALRSLVSVADTGGFRRAAERLHLSQSAVSQHIRRLEVVCQAVLLERDGRGARFTPDGVTLVNDARAILRAHDDALDRLTQRADRDELVIGSTEHAADLLLPVITESLRRRYPSAPIRFRIARGAALCEGLDSGTVDAALLLGSGTTNDVAAGVLPLGWYAAPGWRRPDDERTVPVVVIDGACTIRLRAIQALSDNGLSASVVCESGHLAGVVNAARAGVGVALLAHRGNPPEGLLPRRDLPALTPEPLHVRGRSGARADVVSAVAAAVSGLLTTPAVA